MLAAGEYRASVPLCQVDGTAQRDYRVGAGDGPVLAGAREPRVDDHLDDFLNVVTGTRVMRIA